jgi:hypothetical protein
MLGQRCNCNGDVEIPVGIPFVGGSDDPSELIGASPPEDGEDSVESGDPGV